MSLFKYVYKIREKFSENDFTAVTDLIALSCILRITPGLKMKKCMYTLMFKKLLENLLNAMEIFVTREGNDNFCIDLLAKKTVITYMVVGKILF